MAAPLPRYLTAGESALVVEFGDTIDPILNDHVLALDLAVNKACLQGELPGIIETVPTYRSLMIHFDPRRWMTKDLISEIATLGKSPSPRRQEPRRWDIPACYEPPFAEDLLEVANTLHLSEETVINLHSDAIYRVYMYGFAPGFTFLGGLPAALGISRREVPRPPAPSQSLMIAGGQALISSYAMPTGWFVLGRTPRKLFDPQKTPPVSLDIGDEIRFRRINAQEFSQLNEAP